jgi:hypothetical protein
MSDVTQFSGMFAKMALEYSKSATRRRGRRPAAAPSGPYVEAVPHDERAIRDAMENALARRAQSKRTA